MAGLGLFYLAPSYQQDPPPDVNVPGLTNPYMQGIAWRTGWKRLEPGGSGPDFTWLDAGLAASESHSKLTYMEVLAGLTAPDWFFALPGVQILNLTEHGPTTVCWDPIFQTHWEALNTALAARYDGRIAYFVMGGIGRASESFVVKGDHVGDQALADTLAQANGYPDAITAWKAGTQWIIDMHALVWINTPFVLVTGAPFPVGGTEALQAMFDYGNATYPGRFGARADDLGSLKPHDGELSATAIQQTSPLCIATGYQFGHEQNIHDPNPPTNLGLALPRGIGFGAHLIELFTLDADDPVSAPALLAAMAALGVLLPDPPVAEFHAEQVIGQIPFSVRFFDDSTGEETSWAWNFGDGHTSALQEPTHIYLVAGIYNVTLTVTNDGGSDTLLKPAYITATLLYQPPPPPSPQVTISTALPPTYSRTPRRSRYLLPGRSLPFRR